MTDKVIVSKGKFVRYSDKDEQGSFSYVGKVVSLKKEMVSMSIPDVGVLTVPYEAEKFSVAKKPRKWDEPKAVVKPKVEVKTKTVKTATKVQKGSAKLDAVVEIVKQSDGLTNKQLVAQVMEEVGMTIAGARTYIYNARKKIQA